MQPTNGLVALIAMVIAALADRLWRRLMRSRRWAPILRDAQRELESRDPSTTNDPEEAVERSYVKHNRKRIRSQSISLKPRAGSHSERGNGNEHKATPAHGVTVARTTTDETDPP